MSVQCLARRKLGSISQIGPDLNDSALRPALLALYLARIGESNNDRPVRE